MVLQLTFVMNIVMAVTADLINDITLGLSQGKAFLQKSTKILLYIEIWVTLGHIRL